jgi:AcrR family transcriptional regulator
VAAILEAAAEVIDDVGWSRASTNRIAERAGVSIGSLYQYYPNKEAILAGLYEKHHHEVDAVVGESIELLGRPEVSITTVLTRLFADLIRMHRRDPVLARVLSTAVPLRSPSSAPTGGTGDAQQTLVGLLSRRPEVRSDNLGEAVRILEISVEALTRWLVHEAPGDTDIDVFVDESVKMLTRLISRST